MFYANFVLAKKGPLARVWLAAHWEKKLSKAHVFETDLQTSVDTIISPKVKIALRTSGHLLLGVVRIYSRKAKYLLADCTEALIKIKMAFRPDVVDLPLDNQQAAVSAITLPDINEWDVMMTNMGSFDVTATLNNNQCRVEEITMKEDLVNARFMSDDNFFGDTPFGETSDEIMRDEVTLNMTAEQSDLPKQIIGDDSTLTVKDKSTLSINQSNLELDDPMMGDGGFGAGEGLDFLEGFGMEEPEIPQLDALDQDAPVLEPLDDTIVKEKLDDDQVVAEQQPAENDVDEVEKSNTELQEDEHVVPEQTTEQITTGIETTLFSRDTEAFALEPVEVTVGKEKRKRRKRKLIVDAEKIISNEQMKSNISNHDDIVKAAIVAPPTRERMRYFDSSAKTLFSQPCTFKTKRRRMMEIFEANLTTSIPDDLVLPSSQEDEVQLEQPSDILRDAENITELPEITQDIAEVEKTQNEEILEEFMEPAIDLQVEQVGTLNEVLEEEELNEDTLQIPPPFELEQDKTDMSLQETETEEEATDGKDDLQDKRWTKRTQQTLQQLEKGLKKKDSIAFSELSKRCNRKQAAYRFYTLLLLRKDKAISVKQDSIFDTISISKGERFASR